MLQSVIDKIRNYPWMAATGAAIAGFLLIWQTCLQLGLFDGKQPLRLVFDCISHHNYCGTMSEEDCQHAADIDPKGKCEVPTCNIVSRKQLPPSRFWRVRAQLWPKPRPLIATKAKSRH